MVPMGWKAQRYPCRTIAQQREGLVDLDLIVALHGPCSMLSPMYVFSTTHPFVLACLYTAVFVAIKRTLLHSITLQNLREMKAKNTTSLTL
jgi:hypothetical protein